MRKVKQNRLPPLNNVSSYHVLNSFYYVLKSWQGITPWWGEASLSDLLRTVLIWPSNKNLKILLWVHYSVCGLKELFCIVSEGRLHSHVHVSSKMCIESQILPSLCWVVLWVASCNWRVTCDIKHYLVWAKVAELSYFLLIHFFFGILILGI